MALVVGVQVGGALGVVCPGTVDTVYLLPLTRGITLAVGPSWRLDHSQDMNTPVCVREEVPHVTQNTWWELLLMIIPLWLKS